MLKSTYKPSHSSGDLPPLPPGWTEHKAESGHTYYYNASTKESTYKRPAAAVAPTHHRRTLCPRSPYDKPRSKESIPGFEPWILVSTKYGRRFVYNPEKKASYWRIPEKLMPGILQLDTARIAAKSGGNSKAIVPDQNTGKQSSGPTNDSADAAAPQVSNELEDSSEYEEVEVTDDEAGDLAEAGDEMDVEQDGDEHRAKRQRTEEVYDEDMGGFDEDELALQLELMAQEEQAMGGGTMDLFKDLLSDFKINPYSSWDKIIEDGKIIDDPRYTVLPTTKARKEAWEEWSRAGIRELRENRTKETVEKPDPRVTYMLFLEKHATPKLYWPEFKRKFRKEDCMKGFELTDKDREKWYRELINKLKAPQSSLKSELTTFLKSLPPPS
ncbi:unnamed protein product [Parascedosporium putredinis]|uniref:WW domain-containing protein n=1 Tax=Parascedosporium putredinis TaxID=1442378 RepID=A0A9P1ME43_9PEZI|nr:unnamed protein product [Parascedosporium putredinis]CAI8004902.1 unnamed protein product [Parascedosporium putredinis]